MQMFNEFKLCRQSIECFSAQSLVQVEFPAYALSIHMSYKIAIKRDKQLFCYKVNFS